MRTFINMALVFLLTGLFGCKKDTKDPDPVIVDEPGNSQKGSINLFFENRVDTAILAFGKYYLNPKGDSFKLAKFNYYISNLVFTLNDNTTYAEPESYHLIETNAANPHKTLSVPNLPAGSYKSVSFMLGVDSARNNSGAQTGDLDPVKGMFWSWSTGYIFLKCEGSSPRSGANGKALTYHVGGFKGTAKAQRVFNLGFGSSPATVSNASAPTIHLSVNVNELFKSPNLVDVKTLYEVMSAGNNAKLLADNYADMIKFEKIKN